MAAPERKRALRRSGSLHTPVKVGAPWVLALAACGVRATRPDPPAIVMDPDGTAEVLVMASRADVYEAVVRQVRRRGVVQVSSLEGGWVEGQIGVKPLRVEFTDKGGGILVRVRPFVLPESKTKPYSRYYDEAPQRELARVIADELTH